MVSTKEGWTNSDESNEKKNINITDAKYLLELSSTRLRLLGNMQLDITADSTSGTPAAAAYHTMLSVVAFVIDYFNYIEVTHFLDEIKMSQLSEKLMERLLGKIYRKNTW